MEEKIVPGKFVAFIYTLSNADNGEVLYTATPEQPDALIYGLTEAVVPGLAEALKGLKKGDTFNVTLKPEAAFGPRYEENVMDLSRDIFSADGSLPAEVKPGAELPMMTQEGFRVLGRVLEVTPETVKMDFNHPFAGINVKYDGKVTEVRDATPEELQPKHGCGCGCGHDHDSCGDDCGCGDNDCHCGDGCKGH